MKKEKVCIWVFQLVRPSNSQNREKNVRFRETYPRVILHSSFEMSIDDVIGMTHRKKKLEKKVWMQNFIMALREINSDISVWFRDQFQKNTEISSNFNMRMVSLKSIMQQINSTELFQNWIWSSTFLDIQGNTLRKSDHFNPWLL